jgi:hypothetical protein
MSEKIYELIDELYDEVEDVEKIRSIICELKEMKDKLINKKENDHRKNKRNTNDNLKKFECDKCGSRFMSKFALNRHQTTTKKCQHIRVERIFTTATDRVSDSFLENKVKNKNNRVDSWSRLQIKAFETMLDKKKKQIADFWNTEEGKHEKFMMKLRNIYKKKYAQYLYKYHKKTIFKFRLTKLQKHYAYRK